VFRAADVIDPETSFASVSFGERYLVRSLLWVAELSLGGAHSFRAVVVDEPTGARCECVANA
jgi:hypothetical protein